VPDRLPPLLVFADDWDRHPSGCQHLVRRLLDRYAVHWVNTIGTRRPRWDRATWQRGAEKLRQWVGRPRPPARLPAHLSVHNPLMWPYLRRPWDRWLNRRLLGGFLRRLVCRLPELPCAVSKVPVVADLMGLVPVCRWVYYCVDDVSAWPGLDHGALAALEEEAVRRADVVLASSEVLCDKLARLGRPVHLLTHGVDLEHWRRPAGPDPPELAGLARPLVLYWGLVDRRLDPELLRGLAAEAAVGTVVLVGPAADPGPGAGPRAGVVRIPGVAHERLADFARQAAVLVMPFGVTPATWAMQPLKMKEYLASGRPVVSPDLPAVRPWADCLDVAGGVDAFVGAVRLRLSTGLPEGQRAARARLAGETWEAKARQFEQLALAPGCGSWGTA
jgi:glycosyltransferase involved in cell wall biosynthesis